MIGIIIQARMSSSRLPGKVTKPILGRPMLHLLLERLQRVKHSELTVVATSSNEEDNEIAKRCNEFGVPCYRGDLDDVLSRFYSCAKQYKLDTIIRITGDCPVIDPAIVDELIAMHIKDKNDYSNNFESCTLPDGLDCEIFSFEQLERAWMNAKKPSDREHVTPFIRREKKIKKGELTYQNNISHLRWTVDNKEDFELITKIFEALYPTKKLFCTEDILALINQQPELATINVHIKRNEGMDKSLKQDSLLGY
jgi:spore coat polysaccharide biosynthesis protein SpsF (cytidylyltransferase family)